MEDMGKQEMRQKERNWEKQEKEEFHEAWVRRWLRREKRLWKKERQAVGLPGPESVSKEEREEHERTHLPYRSWCEVCVKARGRKEGALQTEGGQEGGTN